jgi:hypothetical protein
MKIEGNAREKEHKNRNMKRIIKEKRKRIINTRITQKKHKKFIAENRITAT